MQETRVRSLGQGDPLEKNGMATYSSILAWRISWIEESGGLQSMGSQRIGHDWATTPSLSRKSWYSSWKPKDQKTPPSSGSGQEQHKQQTQMPRGHVEGKLDLDAWSLLNSEQVAQGRGHRGGRARSHGGLRTVKGSHVTFTAKGSHCKGPKPKWNEVPLPSHCVSPAQHRLQIHASQDCRFPGHRDVGPAPPISAFFNYYLWKILNQDWTFEDFPSGPVAKTLRSQCRGPAFDPGSGNKIPQDATKDPTGCREDGRSYGPQLRPGAAK